MQANDSFDSIAMSLTYDNTLDTASPRQPQAGNLTSDGLLKYEYDPWNP